MKRWQGLLFTVLCGGLLFGGLSMATTAPAADPLVIGVDNVSPAPACPDADTAISPLPPACHNFEYVDFFPNGSGSNPITIHDGDVVQFTLNTGSPDGFHTATLLKPGETQSDVLGELPFAIGDADGPGDAPGQQQFNPAIVNGTFPPAGSGAPNACGDAATPCAYDGSQDLNSGALSAFTAQTIYYKVSLGNTSTTTVPFVCLIHPGMRGALTVLAAGNSAPGSTQAQLDSAAATQYNTETSDALAAESAADSAAKTTNADGTTTWRVAAGVDGANDDHNVSVLEMLPSKIDVKPGDTVMWTSLSQPEIHTVTFPAGSASEPTNPFPFVCETPTGDQPTEAPPCNPPPATEVHYNPQPSGGTVIASPSDVATSGIIAAALPGAPSSYSFSFSSSGAFSYQCHVHDHMTGQISVAAAATRTLPSTGSGPSHTTGDNRSALAFAVLLVAIAAIGGSAAFRIRRIR